jgi:hypothetical protein
VTVNGKSIVEQKTGGCSHDRENESGMPCSKETRNKKVKKKRFRHSSLDKIGSKLIYFRLMGATNQEISEYLTQIGFPHCTPANLHRFFTKHKVQKLPLIVRMTLFESLGNFQNIVGQTVASGHVNRLVNIQQAKPKKSMATEVENVDLLTENFAALMISGNNGDNDKNSKCDIKKRLFKSNS